MDKEISPSGIHRDHFASVSRQPPQLVSGHSAAEANLEAVLGALPLPLVMLDTVGNVLSWNSAAEDVFGWTAEEVMSCAIPIIPAEEQERANEIFYRLLAGEPVVDAEIERRRKDGSSVVLSLSAAPLRDSSGSVGRIVEIYSDITEKKATHRQLEHLARHDSLTGLANRSFLSCRMEEHIEANLPFTLILLDLDGFKEINDTWGHLVGDEILRCVAQRLQAVVRSHDLVARLGGDEFAIMVSSTEHRAVQRVVNRLEEVIREPYELGAEFAELGSSVGLARYPSEGQDWKAVLNAADQAMYRSKRAAKKPAQAA